MEGGEAQATDLGNPKSPLETLKFLDGRGVKWRTRMGRSRPAVPLDQGLPEIRFLKSPSSRHTHASTLVEASGFLPPIFASLRH